MQVLTAGKRVVGIYLDENRLDYVHAVKRWGQVRLEPLENKAPSYGTLAVGGQKGLEAFLRDLSPKSDRRLSIALPRNLFFIRDIDLPPVPMEDALEAVRSALPIHVHLPVEDVYWDVRLVRRRNKTVAATLVYVEKKAVDGILSVLSETGHGAGLESLFPVSFGLAAWLRDGRRPPVGLVRREEGFHEVLAVDPEGVVRTRLLDPSEGLWGREELLGLLEAQWGVPAESVDDWNEIPKDPGPFSKGSSRWPHPKTCLGVAAAMPLFSRGTPLCLDGRAPRVPGVHPAKVVLPLLLVLVLAAWALWGHLDRRAAALEVQAARLAEETKRLEAELKPLEKNAHELEQLKKLIMEADIFIKGRPRFYELLNDMAERVPEGTWISQLNYAAGKMTVSFQSPDSMKTLEKLRESPFLKDVKLQGSVNRGRDGKETFNAVLELK